MELTWGRREEKMFGNAELFFLVVGDRCSGTGAGIHDDFFR